MIDGLSGAATAPPVPVSKSAAASPATNNTGTATELIPEKLSPKAPLQGFNPALSIDPHPPGMGHLEGPDEEFARADSMIAEANPAGQPSEGNSARRADRECQRAASCR